MDNAELVA